MRMKIVAFALGIFIIFPFVLSSVSAHTLTTATGHEVDHDHFGYCGPNGCPFADAIFEHSYNFQPTDRISSGTASWNCHGRTFDDRRSWISDITPFWIYDSPVCPASPQTGDTVLFWHNGKIIHSVTMVGPWNGTSTLIMSKYGTQGQYRHALANSINIYGKNWSIIRFNAGTIIYQALHQNNKVVQGLHWLLAGLQMPQIFSDPIGGQSFDLLKEREKMPWYQDVLSSQEIYGTEHPKIVAKMTKMNPENLELYKKAATTKEKIAVLINDFLEDRHYIFVPTYDSPEYTTDYVAAMQAGNMMVDLAKHDLKAKNLLIDELKKVIFTFIREKYSNYKAGVTLFFLGKILNQNEKVLFKDQLIKTFGQFRAPKGLPPTYTEYYLDHF